MSGIATAVPPPHSCIADSPPSSASCTCRKCGETKPIEAFRITSKRTGRRDTRCRKCYNAYAAMMARRYNAKRRERRRRKLAGALADARSRHTFEEIGNGLIVACGGFEAFVGFWHLHMQATMREKPGSYHAFRLHGAVLNLLLLANGEPSLASMEDATRRSRPIPRGEGPADSDKEDDRPNFSQMTDAELHAMLAEEHAERQRRRSTAGA